MKQKVVDFRKKDCSTNMVTKKPANERNISAIDKVWEYCKEDALIKVLNSGILFKSCITTELGI